MNCAKIIIVGAGPSGIAAATKLLEYGFQNITLLEADNRIGGRIHTIPFADNVVDLGAQWCHGEKNNIVFDLAGRQNELLQHSEDYENKTQYIRSNGEILSEEISTRLQDIIDKNLGTQNLTSFKGPLGLFIKTKFFEELQNWDIDQKIAKEFFENFEKLENAHKASNSLNDLSIRDYRDFWQSEGDNLLNWKGKGYQRFLQLLMKSTESQPWGVLEDCIKLNKRVEKLNWGDRGVLVACDDGVDIQADHVIVTVSLGVLKEIHSNLFEPKLTEIKTQAIETIGFGTVDKIFLEFPFQFWPNNWSGFSLMWRQDDLIDIRGTYQAWIEDVFVFTPVKHQPRLLNGVITGPNARHMETLPENEIINGCLLLLRKFLQSEIPTPINCTISKWFSKKNFKGSYSCRSMKAEKVNAKPADLAEPLINSMQKPVILFAGEATSDHHFSTVHGAVESGWREAKRLVDLHVNHDTF